MNQDLLNYIKLLSTKDKKTLSQKALKTSEEVGELAKAVLSFDNAYATTHRFVNKNKILEEVCDTLLTTLSIAYSLGFDDESIEEMMFLKSEKWTELQLKEDKITYPIPYEIHVTVKRPDNIDKYQEDCAKIGVKPIVIDLENGDHDVMTSSKFFGNNRSSYEKVKSIAKDLTEMGYLVIREKIETIPFHPSAPSDKFKNNKMPKDCYFESHIGIRVSSKEDKEKLVDISKKFNGHLSKNFFKKLEDGSYIQMLTIRNYATYYESFRSDIDNCIKELKDIGFQTEKEIVEFSIYDTKVSHDFEWLKLDKIASHV